MRSNGIYSYKLIFRYLGIFAVVALLMKVTAGAGFGIVIPLALWALFNNRNEDLFFYMLLTIMAVVANNNLLPKSMVFLVEQRGMMALFGLILTLRVAGQVKAQNLKPIMGVMGYVAFMAIPSLAGWCAPVSFMKLLLFCLVFLAYFGSANALAAHPRGNVVVVRSIVLAVAIVFILGSVALIPFPAYGVMRSRFASADGGRALTSLFMGMTSHSQCMGPVVSGLAVILLSDWLLGVRKFSKLYFLLMICCPILIWKTASRTAMMTFLCGVMFVTYYFLKARHIGRGWRGKVMTNFFIIAMLGSLVIMINPRSRESLVRFAVKHVNQEEKVDVSLERITSSRMSLVETALTNFKKSPLIGNGFQVAEEMKDLKIRSIADILSAPIEKGVWVAAVLEEGGIIGFAIFVLFIITALVKLVRMGSYTTAAMLFVFTVSNMGEFSFFSMSYLGGFMWALVFTAAVLDAERVRTEENERQQSLRAQQYRLQ